MSSILISWLGSERWGPLIFVVVLPLTFLIRKMVRTKA